MFYLGEYCHTVKNKRVKLPWRLENEDKLFLFYVKEDPPFLAIGEDNLPEEERESIRMEKYELITEGEKLVIPDEVYEQMPLKSVVILGAGERIEIYGEAEFKKYTDAMDVEDMSGILQNLGF